MEMNNLRIIRHYDASIDAAMSEIAANAPRGLQPLPTIEQCARESDQMAEHACHGIITIAAAAALVVVAVMAVWA